MENLARNLFTHPISYCSSIPKYSHRMVSASRSGRKKHSPKKLKLPKNLRHRRRTETPPDFHPVLHRSKEHTEEPDCEENDVGESDGSAVWESDEIEAISSLFQGRVPQKLGNLGRERPLPLPLPHKIRPLRLPATKKLIRTDPACSSRQPVSNLIYKNPVFLISLARDIRNLPPENDVSSVLNRWAQFLRRGSLSITVRELGYMDLPDRALHVFCWVQNQPHLFPDDRILASTVEVLARANALKMPFYFDGDNDDNKFVRLASLAVYEAMVKGFIKAGNLKLAWNLLSAAARHKRMLSSDVHAKLILELGKNPDKISLVLPLLEELARRDDLKLSQQDCIAVMKICTKLMKFDIVEALYDWFKGSGSFPSIVMYTTVIHSRCAENKYRDAMAVVWEMEGSNCVLDLPAYRVLIKLFVALQDVGRTWRYYCRLKESGFSPGYDIYRDVIELYMASGRFGKCREIWRDAEMAGVRLDEGTGIQLEM